MQHTNFQAAEPSASEADDFKIDSYVFYGPNSGYTGAGPFWILESSFKQTW